jgi:hypothetical protein
MLRYALPITLGAFLLFQVQPMIAKHILPWFGGTPAVWTTCMLFFQVLLLAGYAYSHLLVCRLSPRGQAVLHTAVMVASLALLVGMVRAWGVPLVPGANWKPADSDFPIPRIVLLLTVAVGLPYFVLATTSPMLQAWFGRVRPGVSPYRLYTLSNAGSLLALLSYPVLVEPHLALRGQAGVWAVAYALFVVGYIYCAVAEGTLFGRAGRDATCELPLAAADGPVAIAPPTEAAPSRRRLLLWVALPALASVLLLATTNQMCQEVAVIPFLWVLPLSVYLLSFIICFDNPRWYSRSVYVPIMMLAVPQAFYVPLRQEELNIRLQVGALALALFVCCMVCHGELVALKPGPRRLTGFYLAVAIGGALGGLLVGLLAPVVFTGFWELYVALGLAWLLGLGVLFWRPFLPLPTSRAVGYVLVAFTLALPLITILRPSDNVPVIFRGRNFYGVLRITDEYVGDAANRRHVLVHGRIKHGWQYLDASKRRKPNSYYALDSGIGLALTNHPRRLAAAHPGLRIGCIGLGTGTLAVYGQSGDYLRFYEINPRVLELARDPRYFTYLADCPGQVEVALGDGRLSLERELQQGGGQRFDVLALDAFSSDAIPAHLLTREAFELYLRHLRDDQSILAVHISNRALDLRPVVYTVADELGMGVATIHNPDEGLEVTASDWMLMTRNPAFLQSPRIAAASIPRDESRPFRLWTDDYYNLFQIIK